MKKIPKQEYTAEFKEQAVKHAQAEGVGVAARELGLVEQTLRNWVKAAGLQNLEDQHLDGRIAEPPHWWLANP